MVVGCLVAVRFRSQTGVLHPKLEEKITVKKAHKLNKDFIRDGGHEQLLSNGGMIKPALPKEIRSGQ
jgi:hypothetical protein